MTVQVPPRRDEFGKLGVGEAGEDPFETGCGGHARII
jgi:hypothetical protein